MRPLITFALFSFNQERFIREAIEGALSQTYTPLEIILSDDCSTDRSFEIMEEMAGKYRGKHKIIINKNVMNLGIGGHINKIMELSTGELIVGAAGDDISFPERVEKIYTAYKTYEGKSMSMFSNYINIDEYGREGTIRFIKSFPDNYFSPKNIIGKDSLLPGCTHAWHKDNFKIFGDIVTPLTCEDMVIPFRSALMGNIIYIPEILVKYRQHGGNVWLHDQTRNITHNVEKEIEKEMNHNKMWAFERRNIYINRIKDIQIGKKILSNKRDSLENMEIMLKKYLLYAEEDIHLYNSSFMERVKIIFKNILHKRDLNNIRYKVGVFLMPWVYIKYRCIKYRMSNYRNIT